MDAPKISVLMPVYNVENYLRAALDSVLNQTLQDIELICVEDGSTDGSLAILEEYAAREPRMTLLRHAENQGTLMARKHCMQAAAGQYVMWLDPDDELAPDACKTVWEEMQRDPVDVLQFDTQVVACGDVSEQRAKNSQRWLRPYTKTIRCEKNSDGTSEPELIKACFEEKTWGWTIWNKAYSAALCKQAEKELKEQHINIAEDEYIFFLLSYFAQSYRGIAPKLYRYYFGRGITGQGTISLRQFHSHCERAKIYPLIQEFLQGRQGADGCDALLEKMQDNAVAYTVQIWHDNLSLRDADLAYNEMLQSYGSVRLISALARNFWGDEEELLRRVAPAGRPRIGARRAVKNLAVFYTRYANGGIERVLSLLLPLWVQMGYRVILVTEEPPCAKDYELPEGVARVVIPRAAESQGKNYALRAQAWQALIERYEIDTVIYHKWFDEILFWDTCLFNALRCNVIVESHGAFSILFYDRRPARYKLIKTMRMVDAVVVLSRTYREFWKNFCPAYYIPNPTTLSPKSECATPNGQTLLWVERLSYEKRPEDVIRAMQRIARQSPQAHLVMVGAGESEADTEKLQVLIRQLGLQEKITLAGYHIDVAPYYRQAAVLLMTSMFEGFPMVLAEAKSYGVPTVMYDLPYLEMVKDARGVVTVPQEDVDALADATVRLLQDEGARQEAARQARASAEDFAAIDLKAAWQNVFDAVSSGAAVMPQTPTEEQLMLNLWLEHQQHGDALADERLHQTDRIVYSKFHKIARVYWKCKDAGLTAVRRIAGLLRH
jgi:glycosyltransferase involved in cell wall biosynthesis